MVGASTQPARVSGRPLGFLRDWGFSGEIAVVNPRHDAVLGYPSYPSAADVPFTPDLAVVCVPATSVLEALEQCAARGVRAAVVFAAGFSEITDGCPDEEAIRELSAATGMAICGPNCLGAISVDDNLPATFSSVLSETKLRSGDVALVTQSGALGIYLYAEAARRGVGFSRWVSTGNECALTISDYIEWLVDDEHTRVICAYIEGIRDGDSFRHALAAAKEAGKPVIVLKGGRSESGAQGVESHTGAIAGDATVFSGVLAGAGAREVDDATELLEVATLERLHPDLPADRGVAIATTSGGGAILASDWLTRYGLRAATLAPPTVATIDDVIPSFGRAENPVDFTGNLMNHPDMVKVAVEALSRDPDVAATVVFVGVGGETADLVVDAILRAEIPDSRILAVVWIGASALVRERLGEGGVPVFADVGPCIRALARLWRRSSPYTAAATGDADKSPLSGGAALDVLLEHELKGQLREAGLSVPPGWLVETGGPPSQLDRNKTYAVKGQARGVVHKVAHGLVRLHCEPDDVDAACAEVVEAAREQQLELDGVLVEEMAEAGVEFLVTLRRDPTFGWTVLVGGGGADVESKRDIVARPCPLTPAAAVAALDTLAVSGSLAQLVDPAAAREAAIGLLVQISASLDRLPPSLVELELNPVIVTPKHALIVDAVAFVASQVPSNP